MVWAIIIILCVAADQLSKAVAESSLKGLGSIPVINGFFYLTHQDNTGAAWSFLADKEWGVYVLAGISFISSIIMIVLIYKIKNVKLKVAITFICAGAIGNMIDRIFYQKVTDFIELHFWSYIFPTFNVADSLITCGSIFLAIVILSDKTIMANEPKSNKISVKTTEEKKEEEKTIES